MGNPGIPDPKVKKGEFFFKKGEKRRHFEFNIKGGKKEAKIH
jgi:hypothetical protein